MLRSAQCLRQQGLTVTDPQPGAAIRYGGEGKSRAEIDAALRACARYDPKAATGPQTAAEHDRALKLAQCLRRHGVDVADPQPGQRIQINGGDGRDQQKVDQAGEECRREAAGPPASPSGAG
jgi:hypothetical protein